MLAVPPRYRLGGAACVTPDQPPREEDRMDENEWPETPPKVDLIDASVPTLDWPYDGFACCCLCGEETVTDLALYAGKNLDTVHRTAWCAAAECQEDMAGTPNLIRVEPDGQGRFRVRG